MCVCVCVCVCIYVVFKSLMCSVLKTRDKYKEEKNPFYLKTKLLA